MSDNKKYTFRKILVISVWILLGSGTIVLLVAAITRKNNEQVTGIEINISGVQNNYFIDKKEVLKILEKTNGKSLQKAIVSSLDLTEMENALQKDQWIKKAEMFFDNNNVLQIKIAEREPVARIFTASGASFYLDSSLARLPLSDKFSARLPVFTNFPTDVIVLSQQDSGLIKDIRTLSEFIGNDPFWMAQVDQVDITPGRTFDLIPKLGNQVIHFGNAENYNEKFNNLLCFYKQVLLKLGWSRYSAIDLQFKGQVVGIRRGANEIKMDSLRSVQIMKTIIAEAQKRTDDSTNIQLEQPADDNSNINTSNEIERAPNEDLKGNKDDNKRHVPVAPIHVPEKPVFENYPSIKKSVLTTHPSSFEKPNSTHFKTCLLYTSDAA